MMDLSAIVKLKPVCFNPREPELFLGRIQKEAEAAGLQSIADRYARALRDETHRGRLR